MSKAGDRFLCVCCREDSDSDEASYDDQYGGPVCDCCRRNSRDSVAWLKHAGIDRPITTDDVNVKNYNRLSHLM